MQKKFTLNFWLFFDKVYGEEQQNFIFVRLELNIFWHFA